MDSNDDDFLLPPDRDEGTRVRMEHDLYLKAVNNPVRRRILELISKKPAKKFDITSMLVNEGVIKERSDINYHVDFLVKANCVAVEGDTISITKGGQVINYFK